MTPHRPPFITDMIISLAVSETSVSSMSAFSTLCNIDLGSWNVPEQTCDFSTRAQDHAKHTTVQGDIETTWGNLLKTLHDVGVLGKIKSFETDLLRFLESLRNLINSDYTPCALELGELGSAKSDRTKTLARVR